MKKINWLVTVFLFLGIIVRGQYSVLVNFNGASYEQGQAPTGSLIFSVTGDTIYGMAYGGATYNGGCIFSLLRNGSAYTDMLDFNGTNGEAPFGSLTHSVTFDTLFGMTFQGGLGVGTVFSYIIGTGYSPMINFTFASSPYYGSYPLGSLLLSVTGDTLFGMTRNGGPGPGNVFSIQTDASNYNDLLDFNGSDGGGPSGSLTFSVTGDSLYGMTNTGGANNAGCIFSINIHNIIGSGIEYKDWYDFNISSGAYPDGSLTRSGSMFYGMTQGGGANSDGVIFSFSPKTNVYTDLLDFNGTNGNEPEGDLTLSGNILYGMATLGGLGGGCIFSYNINTHSYTDLYDFNGTNGSSPYGSLTLSEGMLYGMANGGGLYSHGVLFDYSICNVPIPIIDSLTSDSVSFFVSNRTSGVSYIWALLGSSGNYYGTGDTAWLPIWPVNDTLIFYADSGTPCEDSTVIRIIHNIQLPNIEKPYPRWSKRGMYLDWACNYLGYPDSIADVVNYCKDNHITYVLINGVQANSSTCGVFGTDTAG
jgi:uncharacterized repeat protein (TIGR03803 family)